MIQFYINTNPKYIKVPEIHQYGCRYLQKFKTEKLLGQYKSLTDAVAAASEKHNIVEKCDTCCLGLLEQ